MGFSSNLLLNLNLHQQADPRGVLSSWGQLIPLHHHQVEAAEPVLAPMVFNQEETVS